MVEWGDIASLLPKVIRIGTRGSKLALAQAYEVRERLQGMYPALKEEIPIEIVVIKTTGDNILDRNLAAIGGKGLFTKEIEDALLASDVDIAVHSMKDVPAHIPEGLVIDCILEREDPRDAFISTGYTSIMDLPKGAMVGSSSSRRSAQLLAKRPDLSIIPFRGNVITRLEKLANGVADATFLAVAGLNRINMAEHITEIMDMDVMLPAVAQGAIGVERRANDEGVALLLQSIHHHDTAVCVAAERAVLIELEGSCKTPIAAHAMLAAGTLSLRALIAKEDGTLIHRASRKGLVNEAESLGKDAAKELRAKDDGTILSGAVL